MTRDEINEFVASIPRDENYGHTVAGWIEALQIFAKYFDRGMRERFFCDGEHGQVYFYAGIDNLLPDSDDGKRLIALGFYPDSDSENWTKST